MDGLRHPIDYARLTEAALQAAKEAGGEIRELNLQAAAIFSRLTLASAVVHAAELQAGVQ